MAFQCSITNQNFPKPYVVGFYHCYNRFRNVVYNALWSYNLVHNTDLNVFISDINAAGLRNGNYPTARFNAEMLLFFKLAYSSYACV